MGLRSAAGEDRLSHCSPLDGLRPLHSELLHAPSCRFSASSHCSVRSVRRPIGLSAAPSTVLLSLALVALLCVRSSAVPPHSAQQPRPFVQQHLYYSGSHITSIALETRSGQLFATDVVHGRVIHYNDTGRLLATWTDIIDPPLFSPTSVAYAIEDDNQFERLLYVTDSTSGAVVKVDPDTGVQDSSVVFVIPSEIWECGLLLAEIEKGHTELFVFDRYGGVVSLFSTDQPWEPDWTSDPPPASPANPLNDTYITSVTFIVGTISNYMMVVDAVTDRVMQLSTGGNWLEPLLFPLPADVTGIQAVCWTWCTLYASNDIGCLWVLYQQNESSGAARTVIAVTVQNGTVIRNFTIAANVTGTELAHTTVGASAATDGQHQIQAAPNAHLSSPAMRVIGSGIENDPFRVYMAEADPDGPGHVIVVRDENGTQLQQFDPIPLLYDATNSTMHAFSAVQSDRHTCTLWLTDVDNGGMLVRAAADGTILQHFATPALFSSVVLDVSSGADSSSLVLLFSNATDWQLWRFYPGSGEFVQLNTTSVRQRYNSSVQSRADDAGMAAVGGLAVDPNGRLLLSLSYADTVVMVAGDGEQDTNFTIRDELVRPSLVACLAASDVVVVDRLNIVLYHVEGGYAAGSVPIAPPMSQPLAITYDAEFSFIWISDANGFVFQLPPLALELGPEGTLRPMPAAFDVRSLSLDITGVLYGTDASTRRLIMLPVVDRKGRPSSKACAPFPAPSSSSSSSSTASSASSSSSSSSSSGSQPVPPSRSLLGGLLPLLVGVLCVGVLLALTGSVWWYCRQRRLRRWSVEDAEAADGDEQAVYERWEEDGLDAVAAQRQQRREARELTASWDSDADTSVGRKSGVHVVAASDSRYDAYVRLYEALSEAQGDSSRRWHEAAGQHSMDGPHSRDAPSTQAGPLVSSSSSSTLSTSSASRRSSGSVYASSSDSSDSSGSTSGGSGSSSGSSRHSASSSTGRESGRAAAAASAASAAAAAAAAAVAVAAVSPASIARLSSAVVPRFISEVTDLRILGEGQSGVVYCGYYGSMAVVVKLPKVRSMSAAQWREWQAHLRLPSHPSLVSFVGSLVMYDTNYLVLKWVEQGSLASLLNSPTASRTARWYSRPYGVMRAAADVAQALHHVHRHHLTHRDVSCRNVLVTADGTFVLADLGLAQEPDDTSTSTNTSSVTPLTPLAVPLRWSSPDYLSSHRFTGKSDVWALGVTLWEMASGGRRPYEHISDNRQLQQHIEQGTVGLTVDREWMEQYEQTDEGGLVHTVKQTIDTCMSRDVARRPDAEQLAERVQREMAKWEAEAGEAAERVKAQWAADHAKLAAEVAAVQEAHRAAAANTEAVTAESAAATEAAAAHTPAQPRPPPLLLPPSSSPPAALPSVLPAAAATSQIDEDEDE